jgi:DNA-binding CsgD family transcriptional regulator
MHFMPVLNPLFPLSGVLALQTILIYGGVNRRDGATTLRSFLWTLGCLEVWLLSAAMASLVRFQSLAFAWNTLHVAVSYAFAGALWWFALDLSGDSFRPIGRPRLLGAVAVPLAAGALLAATNRFHRLYWPAVSFSGMTMTAETGPLHAALSAYASATVLASGAIIARSALRASGGERRRSLLFLGALVLGFLGFLRWRLGPPTILDVNPLTFCLALSAFIVGAAVLLYGLPGAEPGDPGLSGPTARIDAPQLSRRQLEIVELVAKGVTYRRISERLGISERTVKYHISQIMEKCGARNRAHLIALLARAGKPGQ